jgi:CheY-like chemotaxis protein
VSVSTRRSEDWFELDVTDTGQGIRAEFLPKLFDRFTQQDSGNSKSFAGLGIGLTIVNHLVSLHDGTVEAFSEGDGQGATFRVRLPLTKVKLETPSEPVSRRLLGVDVLVVEDVDDSRTLISRFLCEAGARVREANSADAALAEIDRVVPDVMVSDIGMARKDGYELIRSLRAAGYTAEKLPAIALTAFVRTEERSAALEAGFQVHLGKPVNAQALIAAVARLAVRSMTKPPCDSN